MIKIIALGAVVAILIVILLFLHKSPHHVYTTVRTKTFQTVQNPTVAEHQPSLVLVDAGTLPDDGRKFVISSASTGKYLADNGIMTSDIKTAKIFTYNKTTGTTNEQAVPNTGNPVELVINIVGSKSLVGSAYNTKDGAIAYGVILNAQQWVFGSIGYNPKAALDGYYSAYGAEFYYV